MNPKLLVCTVLAAALAAPCVQAQDVQKTIHDAEDALGMLRLPQRRDIINTMEYWGTTATPANGKYHVTVSYALPAMRSDLTAASRKIEVVSEGYAWDESVPGGGLVPGTTATPMKAAARARLLEIYVTPFGALKAAAAAGANTKVSTEGGITALTFPLPAPLASVTEKVTLDAKKMVSRVESHGDTPDLNLEATYSDYKDIGKIQTDIMFPNHIVEKRGGKTVLDVTINKTNNNNPYVVFPVPDNVEKAGR
jgi:hypothetical protein